MKLSRIVKGKVWYVEYYIDGERRRVKSDLNQIDNLEERNKEAKRLKKELDDGLIMRGARGKSNTVDLRLVDGLKWAFNEKKGSWAPKTVLDFGNVMDYFYEVAKKQGIEHMPLSGVTRLTIRLAVDRMVKDRKLGAHAYLKYKGVLFNLFRHLKSYDKIENNPADFDTVFRKPKPRPKVLLTPDERLEVREYFKRENPGFLNYIMCLYHTSIRPVELFRLKIEDIDLDKGFITLPKEEAKDKEIRRVVIPDMLRPYLNFGKAPKDFYLFGWDFVPARRKSPVKRDRATKYWHDHVKEILKIKSDLYWVKAMGMRDREEAGISLQANQFQAGHSKPEQSTVYIGLETPANIKQLKEFTKDF